jgi:hypothetical protein
MRTDLEEAIRKVVIDSHDHEIDEAMARLCRERAAELRNVDDK